jgi:chromosome segregation ATPase
LKDSSSVVDSLASQISTLTEAKNRLDTQVDQVNSQLDKDKAKFLSQIEELNSKVKPLQIQLEEEKETKKTIEKEKSQLEKKTNALETELSSLKLKTETQQKEIVSLENQVLAAKHKLGNNFVTMNTHNT